MAVNFEITSVLDFTALEAGTECQCHRPSHGDITTLSQKYSLLEDFKLDET